MTYSEMLARFTNLTLVIPHESKDERLNLIAYRQTLLTALVAAGIIDYS